jgi:hypothetical protein
VVIPAGSVANAATGTRAEAGHGGSVRSVIASKGQPTEALEETMNNKFDELTKGMAQSVTRRQALKKFSFGIVGMALACFGAADASQGKKTCLPDGAPCHSNNQCCSGFCEGPIGIVPIKHCF